MKKFSFILATIMALVYCEKTINIDFTDKNDKVEDIVFTNTITYKGRIYPISKISIDVEEEGYSYYGYNDAMFDIECEAKNLVREYSAGNYSTSVREYDVAFVGAYFPACNYGKMYRLNDKKTMGLFGFGRYHLTEGWMGQVNAYNVEDVEELYYGYFDGKNGYFDNDGNIVNKAAPKVAKYYIDIEHTYKEFYKVYIEFEDAEGEKYILSYKGDKEYRD